MSDDIALSREIDALYENMRRALADAEVEFRVAAERIVTTAGFFAQSDGDVRYYEGVAERVRKELRTKYPAPHSTRGRRRAQHNSKEAARKAAQRRRRELRDQFPGLK